MGRKDDFLGGPVHHSDDIDVTKILSPILSKNIPKPQKSLDIPALDSPKLRLFFPMAMRALEDFKHSDDARLSQWVTPEREAQFRSRAQVSEAAAEHVYGEITDRRVLIETIDRLRANTPDQELVQWLDDNEVALLDTDSLSTVAAIDRIHARFGLFSYSELKAVLERSRLAPEKSQRDPLFGDSIIKLNNNDKYGDRPHRTFDPRYGESFEPRPISGERDLPNPERLDGPPGFLR